MTPKCNRPPNPTLLSPVLLKHPSIKDFNPIILFQLLYIAGFIAYSYCIAVFIVILFLSYCYSYCIAELIALLLILYCCFYYIAIFIISLFLLYCYFYCIIILQFCYSHWTICFSRKIAKILFARFICKYY